MALGDYVELDPFFLFFSSSPNDVVVLLPATKDYGSAWNKSIDIIFFLFWALAFLEAQI